jgi:hypothetical protein
VSSAGLTSSSLEFRVLVTAITTATTDSAITTTITDSAITTATTDSAITTAIHSFVFLLLLSIFVDPIRVVTLSEFHKVSARRKEERREKKIRPILFLGLWDRFELYAIIVKKIGIFASFARCSEHCCLLFLGVAA